MCPFVCLLDYEDIRGFVSGGYKELGNNEGDLTLMVCGDCWSIIFSLSKTKANKTK